MADDDISVKIDEPELPLEDQEKAVQVDKTAPDQRVDAQDELKSQLADLQARDKEREEAREAAERRAQMADQARRAAERRAQTAHIAANDSNLATIESGLQAAKAEAEAAEIAFVAAMEAGDFRAAATAQRKISRAETDAARFEEAKADIASRRDQPQQTAPQGDPIDEFINSRSEPTANWLRSHRDWITNPQKNAKMTAAHWNAVGEGIEVDTPQYFESVETFIGLRKPPADDLTAQRLAAPAIPPKPRRTPVPAAPVTSSASSNGAAGQTVTLSQGEARAATDGTHVWGKHDLAAGRIKDKSLIGQPIGHQEMARRKVAMQKEGHYDRVNYDQ